MYKKFPLFFLFFVLIGFLSCNQPRKVVSMHGEILPVDSTLDTCLDADFAAFLLPYREELEREMGDSLAYAPERLERGRPCSPMIIWATDALLAIAKKKCPTPVDAAIVNVGGVRCDWAKGKITTQNIFEFMPFNNQLVVLTMTGKNIIALCDDIAARGGEGVSGLRFTINKEKKAQDITLNGKEIVPEAYYYIATSDYLSRGNDQLYHLSNHEELWDSHLKLRDLYLEYVKEVGVIKANNDNRIKVL